MSIQSSSARFLFSVFSCSWTTRRSVIFSTALRVVSALMWCLAGRLYDAFGRFGNFLIACFNVASSRCVYPL